MAATRVSVGMRTIFSQYEFNHEYRKISCPQKFPILQYVSMHTHGGGIAYHDKELTFHFMNEL